jgi:nucleoside-diphosphate-sugar epimerase
VLEALLSKGHVVTALVRSDASAATVTAAGATPLVGDITDIGWLTTQLAAADAAIHTASPGDATSADVDRAVAQAVAAAYAGTGKTHVHTGGVWVYGSGADITEELPFNPPAITAWRTEVESIVLGIDGARTVVIEPGIVYGKGGGIPAMITGPRDASGALVLIGTGEQHWSTVEVDDLADLYVLALESAEAQGYYIGVGGDNPTTRELGEAAAQAVGARGVVPETPGDTKARFGDFFGEALLLDQQAAGAKARALGWQPHRPTLVSQLAEGYKS